MSEGTGRSLPRNAILAIVAALAVFLALMAIDRMGRGCGDGLCGSISGGILILALLVATLVFTIRGLGRGETPRWLFAAPWVIWALTLRTLMF